jgi:hypothetical protein
MLRNGHVMIILLTFDFDPCQWQLMHQIFSLTSKEKIRCVNWHFKVPLCWSYWTSLSQMRSADVVKSALDDYFVNFHQRVIASDNWCLGSSLRHVKRRSDASIGISKCVEVIMNEFEQGSNGENPSGKIHTEIPKNKNQGGDCHIECFCRL